MQYLRVWVLVVLADEPVPFKRERADLRVVEPGESVQVRGRRRIYVLGSQRPPLRGIKHEERRPVFSWIRDLHAGCLQPGLWLVIVLTAPDGFRRLVRVVEV